MKGPSRLKILSAALGGLLLVPLATATPAAAVGVVLFTVAYVAFLRQEIRA